MTLSDGKSKVPACCHVLILGAGYGTRLQRDLEQSERHRHLLGVPKALLPLGGRQALLDHWIVQLEPLVPKEAIHVVTNDACYDQFLTWAKAMGIAPTNIVSDGTTCNDQRLGAVTDIQFGIDHFKLHSSNVLVIGGDTLMLPGFDLANFFTTFKQSERCLVTTYTVPDEDVHKFGIVGTDAQGCINSFVEKPPRLTDADSRQACPCFYFFHRKALPYIADFLGDCKARGAPLEAFDATGKCLAYLYSRFAIATYPIAGRIDVGGLASYLEADRILNSHPSS